MKAIVRQLELGKIKDQPIGKTVILGKKMHTVNELSKGMSALQEMVYELVLELDPYDIDENIKIEKSNWQDILDRDLIDKDVEYEELLVINAKTDKLIRKMGSVIFPDEEKLYTQRQFDAEYERGYSDGYDKCIKDEGY